MIELEFTVLKKQLMNRVGKLMSHPDMLGMYIKSHRGDGALLGEYSEKSAGGGLFGRYFVVSFDCDTLGDIKVAGEITDRLFSMGIKPVMAVPGELLLQGAEAYRGIAEKGAEFLNHGYKTHSVKTHMGYDSTYDYKDVSFDEVRKDVEMGDKTLREALEKAPKGFRTPHFGNFQKGRQLKFLYGVLKNLGYIYSTSTIPYFGLKKGGLYKTTSGLVEIPVSGMASEPLRIFDSFFYYDGETDKLRAEEYCREGFAIADAFEKHVKNGIINIYADPSQVYGNEEFFEVMKRFAKVAENITYEKLAEKVL